MEFECDPAKDARIRRERGFADAVAIFAGRVVERRDTRHDYGEVRMVAVGEAGGVFFTVVYTERGAVRRLVKAWPSSRKEREAWLVSA